METNKYFAFGLGVGTKNSNGDWLEAYFPAPVLNPALELFSCFPNYPNHTGDGAYHRNICHELDRLTLEKFIENCTEHGLNDIAQQAISFRSTKKPIVAVLLAFDDNPASNLEVYLKLHLLSHRLAKPHDLNLKGIFGLMPNIAWTSQGPIDVRELAEHQTRSRLAGEVLEVFSVDKFPKLANYFVPSQVRIADTARVRLGAYLGEGTTIMHEGFVNFNAGTLGAGMVEGRISSGVIIGENSDLGGGSSTMGTLSGGNTTVISVGRECLIGANAGIGISLGDRCTVEAGLYVTAGTKLNIFDNKNSLVKTTKAAELSGMSDILYRRNSLSGSVEARCNKSAIKLNEELHSNN